MAVTLSPVLAELAQYPFARLDDWKAGARARGIELIDFGMGDPREVTPPFIREALLASVDPVSSYPRATGLPELRQAVARWIGRRFDVEVDEATEIVPTLGSKNASHVSAARRWRRIGRRRERRPFCSGVGFCFLPPDTGVPSGRGRYGLGS